MIVIIKIVNYNDEKLQLTLLVMYIIFSQIKFRLIYISER